jgi:hypothetical protein
MKRHEQKLVILSMLMLLVLNIPLLLFDSSEPLLGFPIVYIYIFSAWFFSIAFLSNHKNIMSSMGLLFILTLYVSILFILPIGQKKNHSKWTNNPYIYFFSCCLLYCMDLLWKHGLAANSGLSYLPIYVGPIIIIPTWMIILKRIIQFRGK